MSLQRRDRQLKVVLGITATGVGLLVLLVLAFVLISAGPALRDVGLIRFFTDDAWRPAEEANPKFNLVPMLAGSVLVSVGAILLAAPTGIMAAIFTQFYAPRSVAGIYRRMIEIMAGVPSVVFGFWGLMTIAPLIGKWQAPGQSLLAGSIVLSLMILPTVALTAASALQAVPRDQMRAAAALGMGRWSIVRHIALPIARGGISAGIILAVARAIGETMAVVMVCGNVVQWPSSVFDPIRAVTANIALEMGYATSAHRSALFVSGLMLMIVVGLLVLLTDRIQRSADRSAAHA